MKTGTVVLIIVLVVIVALAAWAVFSSSSQPYSENTAGASSTTVPTENGYGTNTGTSDTGTPSNSVQSAYFNETTSATLGTYLTDQKGHTLYVFTQDSSGTSNCTGTCAVIWPPYGPGFTAKNAPTNMPMLPAGVNLIARADGTEQFTWNGAPLYHYEKDTAAGDTLGENVQNSWYVVKVP